jgi:hypothetical protein
MSDKAGKWRQRERERALGAVRRGAGMRVDDTTPVDMHTTTLYAFRYYQLGYSDRIKERSSEEEWGGVECIHESTQSGLQ